MTGRIEQARNVAMEILGPSRKDLEHGMELHAESLVVESYNFSPVAAVDAEAMKAAIEAGASEHELEDLYEEIRMTRQVLDLAARAEYLPAWQESGVTCVVQNAGQECQSVRRVLKRLARFTYVTDMMGEAVRKAILPDDIVEAKRAGTRCLYLMANAVPLPELWNSVEEELGLIRIFFQLGIRMMHLTYNRRNMIGDGCAEPANAGLSDFGGAVVTEMNRLGVIVDVAHSGWRTCLDAARISSRPIVASHTVCHALNSHYRGKPDDVIRAIADTGGYFGICCIPAFLGRSGDIKAFLDHIDHVKRRFGAGHVAIGTDVGYSSKNAEAQMSMVPPWRRGRTPWRSFWHSDDPRFDPRWRAGRDHRPLRL